MPCNEDKNTLVRAETLTEYLVNRPVPKSDVSKVVMIIVTNSSSEQWCSSCEIKLVVVTCSNLPLTASTYYDGHICTT